MDRFWSKVATAGPDDCWPWTAATTPKGYGRWTYREGGKNCHTTAHRKAWELANGPIPAGFQVLHRCDNPPCCNPAHLWLGTHRDNMADKVAKGRQSRLGRPMLTHCKHGHAYTGNNVMVLSNKGKRWRTCRTCHNARSLAAYHDRKT
jgi:hypothetical protein